MPEKVEIRDAFGRALVELGAEKEDVVVLDADVSSSTRTRLFAERFPDRFFNVGVAEQNMLGIAAGLATVGKIPFASTFSFLATLRAGDQFRTSIAYPNLNVKIAAGYGGLSDSYDGPTHQDVGDISVVRGMPNMTIVVVADAVETRKAVFAVSEHRGPVYLRLSRAPVPVILDEKYNFTLGRGVKLRDGGDVAIVATGVMVYRALEAAERLSGEGIDARVINIHTIKPIDEEVIVEAAEETGAIVTAEEHNIYGGLGSAVAEVLAENRPVPMQRVGIRDTFAESGGYEELLDRYGMGIDDIVRAAKHTIERKGR
ncbi:MAG: transketolase family protein [bacterium]